MTNSVAQPDAVADTDEDLMLAFAAGDATAFDELYARHRHNLYAFLAREIPAAYLDDLFQDVWLGVMRSRMNYQTEISFRAWLFQIARNLIIDLRRKKSLPVVRNWVDGNPVHAWADQALAAKQESLQFERALVSLPPPQRETFLLREHAQLSLEEIARLTGVTAEVAKSRLRYALNKLRAALSV